MTGCDARHFWQRRGKMRFNADGMQWRQWIWTYSIYGQILTTPSCVYGRLFTWTRMVDFNALIVWKTVYRHLFFVKSSLWALTAAWYEIPKNDWINNMKLYHRSRPPMYCYFIETPGDITWKKLKAYNFVISGWIKPLQALKRNSGYDSHDATSPLFFPHPPSTFCPSPFLTRVWGITMGKLWN